MADEHVSVRRAFAQNAAQLGCRLGVLSNPIFDDARFRLVDGDVTIDLYNPWYLCDCVAVPDESKLSELLTPAELGAACYLGRLDVVRRLLAGGADPNTPEADGVTPLGRACAAYVTTDLHIAVVTALLDAGLVVYRSQVVMNNEAVGSEVDSAILELLTRRARPGEPPRTGERGTRPPHFSLDDVTPSHVVRRHDRVALVVGLIILVLAGAVGVGLLVRC